MSFIIWIIFGALAGWIASIIMKTNAQQGPIMNIIVGIVGAIVGGFLAQTLGLGPVTGFNIYSLVVAIVGAVILIAIVKAVRGGTSRAA
jgi:uncharacterized membrane protein YeaQ/YmgE (transglycosylase-associated protein family)